MDLKETFHFINLKRKEYFEELLEKENLNMMEVEILVSLGENPDSNTFTDIMRAKDYAKSYVSKAINHLVEQGYIAKVGSEENKKVYKLYLLDKGKPVIEEFKKCVETFRSEAFAGVEKEELEVFEAVLHKISENFKK